MGRTAQRLKMLRLFLTIATAVPTAAQDLMQLYANVTAATSHEQAVIAIVAGLEKLLTDLKASIS